MCYEHEWCSFHLKNEHCFGVFFSSVFTRLFEGVFVFIKEFQANLRSIDQTVFDIENHTDPSIFGMSTAVDLEPVFMLVEQRYLIFLIIISHFRLNTEPNYSRRWRHRTQTYCHGDLLVLVFFKWQIIDYLHCLFPQHFGISAQLVENVKR